MNFLVSRLEKSSIVVALAVATLGLASCDMFGQKKDDEASALATGTDAEEAKPADMPAAIHPRFPTDAEWKAVTTEVTVRGSSARNCETKVLRGYLRVKCGANGDGAPKDVSFVSEAPENAVAEKKDGELILIHPFAAGTDLSARFSWDGATHEFEANWTGGAPQPELVGTFRGATSVLDSVSTDPNVHVYTARIGADDHKNSRGTPLTRAVDMIRQDRANFHKFGKRDTGDSADPLFTSKEERAQLSSYLEKLPDNIGRSIEQRMPLLRVEIDQRGPRPVVQVSILDKGAPLP